MVPPNQSETYFLTDITGIKLDASGILKYVFRNTVATKNGWRGCFLSVNIVLYPVWKLTYTIVAQNNAFPIVWGDVSLKFMYTHRNVNNWTDRWGRIVEFVTSLRHHGVPSPSWLPVLWMFVGRRASPASNGALVERKMPADWCRPIASIPKR